MREEVKDVKLGGKVVATAAITRYDDIDDLLANEDPNVILADCYYGRKVRIMSNIRQKHSPKKAGKSKRFWTGLSCLSSEELISVAGDEAAMKALVESDEIQERVDKILAVEEEAA